MMFYSCLEYRGPHLYFLLSSSCSDGLGFLAFSFGNGGGDRQWWRSSSHGCWVLWGCIPLGSRTVRPAGWLFLRGLCFLRGVAASRGRVERRRFEWRVSKCFLRCFGLRLAISDHPRCQVMEWSNSAIRVNRLGQIKHLVAENSLSPDCHHHHLLLGWCSYPSYLSLLDLGSCLQASRALFVCSSSSCQPFPFAFPAFSAAWVSPVLLHLEAQHCLLVALLFLLMTHLTGFQFLPCSLPRLHQTCGRLRYRGQRCYLFRIICQYLWHVPQTLWFCDLLSTPWCCQRAQKSGSFHFHPAADCSWSSWKEQGSQTLSHSSSRSSFELSQANALWTCLYPNHHMKTDLQEDLKRCLGRWDHLHSQSFDCIACFCCKNIPL